MLYENIEENILKQDINKNYTIYKKKTSTNEESEYSDVEILSDYSEEENNEELDDVEMMDVDLKNFGKPLSVSRYAEKIILNEQREEEDIIIKKGSFENIQKEITPKMRSIVVKWLITISDEFNFSNETLFNSIAYLDHYLEKYSIKKDFFQLLGSVCLWMASKVEEREIPSISDFTELCNKSYTNAQFCKLECDVFKYNSYRVNYPTTKTFLRRFQCAVNAEKERDVLETSSFLCEASLLNHQIPCIRPSSVAFSIIAIAIISLKKQCPFKKLLDYSHFSNLDEVKEATPLVISTAKDIISKKQGTTYQRYTGLNPDPPILKMDLNLAQSIIESYEL